MSYRRSSDITVRTEVFVCVCVWGGGGVGGGRLGMTGWGGIHVTEVGVGRGWGEDG